MDKKIIEVKEVGDELKVSINGSDDELIDALVGIFRTCLAHELDTVVSTSLVALLALTANDEEEEEDDNI